MKIYWMRVVAAAFLVELVLVALTIPLLAVVTMQVLVPFVAPLCAIVGRIRCERGDRPQQDGKHCRARTKSWHPALRRSGVGWKYFQLHRHCNQRHAKRCCSYCPDDCSESGSLSLARVSDEISATLIPL